MYDAAAEWHTAADEPDRRVYRGLAELRDLVQSLAGPWEGRFSGGMEFEEFIDRGEWVVVPWRARWRGKQSGVPTDVRETYAVRVVEGRIAAVREYRTREQALEAVGS